MNPYRIDIQHIYPAALPFKKSLLTTWAALPLRQNHSIPRAELTLRIVSNDEIQALNQTYRHKDKPTNVLAFPSTLPKTLPQRRLFLGDIVIAPDVLFKEHQTLKTELDAHWAHIIIHGVLHLLGYDHQKEEDTKQMQALEIALLEQLHFPNPYLSEHPYLD